MLNRIQAKQRIILTGTPVQNCFDELVNLLQFVDPFYFGDAKKIQLENLAELAAS